MSEQNSKLNVASNETDPYSEFYSAVAKLKKSGVSDEEINRIVKNMNSSEKTDAPSYSSTDVSFAPQRNGPGYISRRHRNDFFPSFGMFASMEDHFNKMTRHIDSIWNSMSSLSGKTGISADSGIYSDSFERDNEYNISDTDEIDPKHSEEKTKSYIRYTSSVTSYNKDGTKTSKTVSGSEKIGSDGKRIVRKKIIKQDGDNMTTEELLPDGNKRITTTKTGKYHLDDN